MWQLPSIGERSAMRAVSKKVTRLLFKPVVLAGLLTAVLIGSAIWFVASWTVPSYATKEFVWEEIRPIHSADDASGAMYVSFHSNGPLAADSEIFADRAVLYLTSGLPVAAPVDIFLNADLNTTGSISFSFPSITRTTEATYFASVDGLSSMGKLRPSSADRIELRARIALDVNGSLGIAWSQYLTSPPQPPETWIDLGPPSDLYTFLGLKAAFIGLLLTAATQIFPAMDAAMNLRRYRKDSDIDTVTSNRL